MTTLEPEQKDILEKLNEIALEAHWGTVDRDPNGIPKGVAVIQEAIEEIKRLREEIVEYDNLIGIREQREFRHKFVDEIWRGEMGHNLSTPDFDFVYQLFFEQREKIANFEKKESDLHLYGMQMKNGEIDMTLGSEHADAFIFGLLQIFAQNGAKNFLTTDVEFIKDGQRYTLTIQKVGGQTPAEKLSTLRDETRKKTAKEILQGLFDYYSGDNEEGFSDFEVQDDLKDRARKYGVTLD